MSNQVEYISCEQMNPFHYRHTVKINGTQYVINSSKNEDEYRKQLESTKAEAEEIQTEAQADEASQTES